MINSLKSKTYNFLRYTQKYTGTDNVYLARGGFWLIIGNIIAIATSFLVAITLGNFIDKGAYGNYQFALAIIAILGLFTLPQMGTAVTRSVARGFEGSIIKSIRAKILFGFGGTTISLALAGYYFLQSNSELATAFLVASFFIPFISSFKIYNALLSGKKLFKEQTKYFAISQSIYTIILISVIFSTDNFIFILLANLAANSLLHFIFLNLVLKKIHINKKIEEGTIKYGRNLSIASVFATTAQYIDKIIIFHYFGAVEVAIYVFAIYPTEQIKGLLKNIMPLSLPKFSSQSGAKIRTNLFPKLVKLSIFTIIITAIYIIFAPIFYKIFLPAYKESVFFSQIFALSLIITSPIFLLISALQSQKKTKELYIYNMLHPLFTIILVLILAPMLGILGAILARIISRILNLVLSLILVRRL